MHLCKECYDQGAKHTLFQCSELKCKRDEVFPQLIASMPPAMADVFKSYESRTNHVTSLMLSGLHGGYIPEWNSVYQGIIHYVNSMYEERKILHDGRNIT